MCRVYVTAQKKLRVSVVRQQQPVAHTHTHIMINLLLLVVVAASAAVSGHSATPAVAESNTTQSFYSTGLQWTVPEESDRCPDAKMNGDMNAYLLPQNMAISQSGDIFIVETNYQRIMKMERATGQMSMIAGGVFACGTTPHVQSVPDGTLAVGVTMSHPLSPVIASINGLNESLYFAEFSAHCIRRIDISTGKIYQVAGTCSESLGTLVVHPDRLAIDRITGDLYFTTQEGGMHVLRVISSSGAMRDAWDVLVHWDFSFLAHGGILYGFRPGSEDTTVYCYNSSSSAYLAPYKIEATVKRGFALLPSMRTLYYTRVSYYNYEEQNYIMELNLDTGNTRLVASNFSSSSSQDVDLPEAGTPAEQIRFFPGPVQSLLGFENQSTSYLYYMDARNPRMRIRSLIAEQTHSHQPSLPTTTPTPSTTTTAMMAQTTTPAPVVPADPRSGDTGRGSASRPVQAQGGLRILACAVVAVMVLVCGQ